MENYNHTGESLSSCTGVDVEKVKEEAFATLQKFMADDDQDNWSFFTKAMEENLTKRELAFIATNHMQSILDKGESETIKSNPMMEAMRSMRQDGDFEDDKNE
jgi:hypothetical protein